MFCPKCGIENPDDSLYCMNCGIAVSENAPPRMTVVDIYANKKSVMTAVLLSCFVPGLGQMYLGRYDIGLKFLITEAILTALFLWLFFSMWDGPHSRELFRMLEIGVISGWISNIVEARHLTLEYNRGVEENRGLPPW